MSKELTRRDLIRSGALVTGLAALGGVWSEIPARASRSPNEKLNIAAIGAGGMGASDIKQFPNENVVALCDVDFAHAAGTFQAFPNARRFDDFRRMLEEMDKSIDAVTVSTADHSHAVAAAMAMRMGKHVYCQKPLTHSVHEARELARLAAANPKLATQMGTQGHAYEGNIRAVELIRGGVIGAVKEVHVVTDRPAGWWPQNVERPTDTPPVPSTLNWDVWLGPAPARPYHPAYHPFRWRGWWDFGTGALGDMACHLMDVAFWSLELRDPDWVEAVSGPMTKESPPLESRITYHFPARRGRPEVALIWYDGKQLPPEDVRFGRGIENGSIFVGEKGTLFLNHGDAPLLLPEDRFRDATLPPKTLPRPESHYLEWAEACKGRGKTGSHFGYAGPFTEAVLLGNVALRVGHRIEWDARRMRCKNAPNAEQYIKPPYRKGWKL